MSWIQPLSLETWMVSVLAGTPEIFSALAIMVIMSMSAYFRMNTASAVFMVIIFLLMVSGTIEASLITFMAIIGGLLIGYILANVFNK